MRKNAKKIIGLICAVVLLISAMYIPYTLSVNAAEVITAEADKTVTFDFEDCVYYSHATNKAEFEATGLGLAGWGGEPITDNGNKVWRVSRKQVQTWATIGAVRLNKKVNGSYQVYNLEPSSKYVVTLKVRGLSAPVYTDEANTPHESYVALGYGAKFNSNDTNYVSTVDKTIVKIVSAKAGNTAYTLATDANGGTASCSFDGQWHEVTYIFSTPANLGSFDHALSLLGSSRTGFSVEFDDVAVTKLSSTTGIVTLVDDYSGKTENVFGKIGSEYNLPDIKDRSQADDHKFIGWYSDEARTKAITKLTFAAEQVKAYSGWLAPVTVTFVDDVNNTSTSVTGVAGESFEYPKDPVNPENTSWFMGWYTSKSYDKEHTSGKFGYANISLYAYFKGKIPEMTQDFENYPYCKKEVETVTDKATGVAYKKYKDSLIIGNTYTLQSDVTASSNSKKALKFVWDKTKQRDLAAGIGVNDPDSYNSAKRYYEYDNFIWLGKGIEDKQNYIVSFKYKVEKADSKVEFYAFSASASNGWADFVRHQSGHQTLKVSDEWQEYSFQFTTAFKKASSNYMYLGIRMEKNEDVILYIDDVKIQPVAQPYESLVVIDNGYDNNPINVKGVRGEKIVMPEVKHPNDAKFLGYYTDKDCTEEFVAETFARKPITVYAKWGVASVKFNDLYTYDTDGSSFGKSTLSIAEEEGGGYDDDYALKFRFDAKAKYSETALMNTRYNQRDHGAVVAKKIESGALYHVSYYIKNSSVSNAAVTLTIGTGWVSNIWANDTWRAYDAFKVNVKPNGEWTKVDFYFVPDVKTKGTMEGDALYFLFGAENSNADNYIEAYVDNVLVEKIDGDYIYFHGNAVGASEVVVAGKAGESFTVPTLENGKSKFLGFFLDEGCTEPFTAKVMPEGETHVYAKWETAPIAFDGDYPYPVSHGNGFGRLFNIVNENGVGNGDNYAMVWKFKGSDTYLTADGKEAKWATRATQHDHVMPILKTVDNNTVYHITYDYYVSKNTNVKGSITPASGFPDNIWVESQRVFYNGAAVTFAEGGTDGWKTADLYLSSNLAADNNWFYLQIKLASNDEKNVAEVRIDNLKIEKIVAPYVFFDAQNGEDFVMVRGKAGDKIVAPTKVERFGYSFKGWYANRECTEKFALTEFAKDTAVTVYAGWTPKSEVTYSFEKYDLYNGYNSKQFFICDAKIDSKKAKSGKKSIHFTNRTEGNYNKGGSYVAVAHGVESCKLEIGNMYVVNVNYCVNSADTGSLNMRFVGGPEGHYWAGKNNQVFLSEQLTITSGSVAGSKGKWLNKTFVIDTNVVKEKGYDKGTLIYNCLFLEIMGAEGWDFCVDDITVTKIPKGKSAVSIDNQGCSKLPNVIIGNPGASFASKLPENVEFNDMYFKGYYLKDAQGAYTELKREDMKFGKEAMTIYARFLDYEVKENFDTDYISKTTETAHSYTTYDFDYEIYDAEAKGNSKENVTSGRYSLHRKGNSMYFENAVILTLGNQIAEGERYTVSFKVKMGKALQTDGAIKVVSGRSFKYAWTTTGDYYAVVPIADLTDGQWHEVSYTFNSVEAFACIQTPGYVELFMDDFKFTLAGDEAPLSNTKPFTEYVPAKRDKDGNLVEKEASAIDVTSIIDISLYVNNNLVIWIIAAAAVIVIAGGVLLFIFLKKKKNAKS